MIKKLLFTFCACTLLAGCASTPNSGPYNSDPYEGFNRAMFTFNTHANRYFLSPVVQAYDFATPAFSRNGVRNVFSNLEMFSVITNDALQGNGGYFWDDVGRFVLNATLGCLGLFDVATPSGLPARNQSFGLTLAKWGVHRSPYLILPFMGPTTVRGGIGMIPDAFLNPVTYVSPVRTRYALYGLEFTQVASDVLPQEKSLTSTAIDPYIAVRNAYLQNRKYSVARIVHETPIGQRPPGGLTEAGLSPRRSIINAKAQHARKTSNIGQVSPALAALKQAGYTSSGPTSSVGEMSPAMAKHKKK
jgi:phospholipid-binding lipoprotein MlaA